MCATLCAVEFVAQRRPQEFKHLVPSLISILKQAGPHSACTSAQSSASSMTRGTHVVRQQL